MSSEDEFGRAIGSIFGKILTKAVGDDDEADKPSIAISVDDDKRVATLTFENFPKDFKLSDASKELHLILDSWVARGYNAAK